MTEKEYYIVGLKTKISVIRFLLADLAKESNIHSRMPKF